MVGISFYPSDELKKKLKGLAEKEKRTLNGLITYLLEISPAVQGFVLEKEPENVVEVEEVEKVEEIEVNEVEKDEDEITDGKTENKIG